MTRCDGRGVNWGNGRVLERRRAVALARHYREFERLSIREIAERLGRSPATVKAYFYDPTGEKARAVKARYVGAVPRLRRVHAAAQRQGRRLRLLQGLSPRRDRAALDPRAGARRDARVARALRPAAVVVRLVAHARAPAWGRAARTNGPQRMAGRERGRQPVRDVGCRAGARVRRGLGALRRRASEPVDLIGHTGDLCAQSTEIARKIRQSEEVCRPA